MGYLESAHLEDWALLLRLVAALVLSSLLGLEREVRGKVAGLRTHALVGVTSALIVCLVDLLMARAQALNYPALKLDPLVTLGAVISGVSFLGAGTIFFSKNDDMPHGLTTAASLLAVAAVGIACGLERYFLALSATSIYLIILQGMRFIEQRVDPRVKNNS